MLQGLGSRSGDMWSMWSSVISTLDDKLSETMELKMDILQQALWEGIFYLCSSIILKKYFFCDMSMYLMTCLTNRIKLEHYTYIHYLSSLGLKNISSWKGMLTGLLNFPKSGDTSICSVCGQTHVLTENWKVPQQPKWPKSKSSKSLQMETCQQQDFKWILLSPKMTVR